MEGKGKKSGKKLRRWSVGEGPPMTAVEYFIYVCTILFVAVFAVMQGVFLYKLNLYEASTEELHKAEARALAEVEEKPPVSVAVADPTVRMSNRQRIEFMSNATRREFTKWPPLDAIVNEEDGKITGDPQFLLDFGLIGFEKAGTKTIKLILSGHKEVDLKLSENVKLYLNKPAEFISVMYDMHPNQDRTRGYNCINDIYQPSSLRNIHTYFPDTKLIIAIRHPIRWFESLYNARIQNLANPDQAIPTPQERIGICKTHDNGCCTDHAHLALWLYKLGKTLDMPPAEIEETIKNTHQYESAHTTLRTKNKFFLVEASQLVEQDWFRQQELLDDLQAFLGLDSPFKNGIPPAQPAPRSDTQDKKDKRKIDICQDQYKNLREELMIGARESSQWIRERFMKSPDVFTSSPDYVEQALLSWLDDPCSKKATKKEFDTKTIEGEIPFKANAEPIVPVAPGSLKVYDINQDGWPTLDQIVDSDNKLIGDPQFLLDFAIIGIEKCGTSTLMKWLGNHPEIQCFQHEETSMFQNQPGLLAKRLYKRFPREDYKRGYKNPIDLFQPCTLRNFRDYYPETKLIIALRHPVRYFESLHNFRIQNLPDPNGEFTPIEERIGICNQHSQGLCTDHANFALWLWRLGKTLEMTMNDLQKDIKMAHPYEANHYTYPSTNKVFLIEMSQFKDDDANRTAALRTDLARYLGLKHSFDEEAPHAVPGMKWSAEVQAIRDSRKIDICEERYKPVRDELMKGSRQTSLWIRTFFLASKDVFISSPEFFDKIMRDWMNDPCEDSAEVDPRTNSDWPRLGSLVDDDGKITGDVQFLLDFAIIGVEKCGTSTLMVWLGQHPEIQCPQEENYSLMHDTPGQLVQDMYAMAPYEEYARAYKNPIDLFYPGTSLAHLDHYFPETKLLITLRHPVKYFESLYNFRIQNHNQGNWDRSHIPTPKERIGQCVGDSHDGCTEHAHFGLWLYRLGKTVDMPETELQKSFFENHPQGTKKVKPNAMKNEIFLFEMSQFADSKVERMDKLKSDLKHFLGATKDFDGTAPHKVPGKHWSEEIQAVRDAHKIDICEDEHKEVREVLLKGARETSLWIRESFIKSPDVHISSPSFFEECMLKWMDDPCDDPVEREKGRRKFRKHAARGDGIKEELAHNA